MHTYTRTKEVRGGDDGVAIETVLFQVWSVRMIKKSSNELSHPTYLMPFELSECKPEYNRCEQKLFICHFNLLDEHLVKQSISKCAHLAITYYKNHRNLIPAENRLYS